MHADSKQSSGTFGRKEAPVVVATTDIGDYGGKMPYNMYGKKKKKKRDNR